MARGQALCPIFPLLCNPNGKLLQNLSFEGWMVSTTIWVDSLCSKAWQKMLQLAHGALGKHSGIIIDARLERRQFRASAG